jgi:hypothetical protein
MTATCTADEAAAQAATERVILKDLVALGMTEAIARYRDAARRAAEANADEVPSPTFLPPRR